MWLDYEKIQKKIANIKELAILASKDYSNMVEDVYTKIQRMNNEIEIFILSGDTILCPSKATKFDFYVVLGVACPLHNFDDAVYVNQDLNDEDLEQIKNFDGNVICDSTFNYKDGTIEHEKTTKCMIVSKNSLFKRYYATQKDCTFLFGYDGESKMDFLMARINKAEKVRAKQIFAVLFTSYIFEEKAIKVKNQIVNSGRYAYLLHLKNVHYNRLITIEGIDAIVMIDCPLFDNLNIDIFIPIVTPCEINYMLTGQWDGIYDSHKIDEKHISTTTDLTQVKGAGEIILQSGFLGLEFGSDNKDYKIYEGQTGIADSYEKEGE
ncbi:hypothetical protein NGRA_0069 [Nosema granulosis]|uniref:Diphthamide biosynthesis protein 2 n=1 Tax=Nosema granulosis TaxID=83296 RepID=A0A9P6H491_9MICR|nr:hypothetical protein NGRA_0069 [Nosema granulosis]